MMASASSSVDDVKNWFIIESTSISAVEFLTDEYPAIITCAELIRDRISPNEFLTTVVLSLVAIGEFRFLRTLSKSSIASLGGMGEKLIVFETFDIFLIDSVDLLAAIITLI